MKWLGVYEARLRANSPGDPLITGFWTVLVRGRFVVVWSFAVIVLLGTWAATLDESCRGVSV